MSVEPQEPEQSRMRIDKWLWYARFFKSRSMAARFVANGKIRINRQRTSKASRAVRPDDVLTFVLHGKLWVIRVCGAGMRRGPAVEARALYEELPG